MGFLISLISITFVNIVTKSSAYSFKDNIFNIYFSLNIYCNSFTNIILALCLANFNHHLIENNSLFM